MVTCERCNTENLDGSQYCDESGALLAGGSSRVKKVVTNPAEEIIAPASAGADAGNIAAPATTFSEPAMTTAHSEVMPVRAASSSSSSGSSSGFGLSASSGAARTNNGPHAKLVIHRGRSAGKEFPMNEDEAQIGRWDADGGIFPDVDLDADDPEAKVSRRHARITRRGEQYFIEDLGSTNGTFINRGRRLLPGDRQPLNDGDEVIVGKTFLRFQVIK